jgi:preprotein translocase subunit SecA
MRSHSFQNPETLHFIDLIVRSKNEKEAARLTEVLINKMSSAELDSLLLLKNTQGHPFLAVFGEHADPAIFLQLVEKGSQKTIDTMLLTVADDGCSGFIYATIAGSEGFTRLIEKASPHVVDQSLLLVNEKQRRANGFMGATSFLEPVVLNRIFEIASPSAIEIAILHIGETNSDNGFISALSLPSVAFVKLIEKISPDTINKLLLQKIADTNGFIQAIMYLKNSDFIALIGKADPSVLEELKKDFLIDARECPLDASINLAYLYKKNLSAEEQRINQESEVIRKIIHEEYSCRHFNVSYFSNEFLYLLKYGWSFDGLKNLLNEVSLKIKFRKKVELLNAFSGVINIIHTYSIQENSVNSNNLRVKEIINQCSYTEWESQIYSMGVALRLKNKTEAPPEKTLDTLINEIKASNSTNPLLEKLLQDGVLKKQYVAIEDAYLLDSSFLSAGKAIKKWEKNDCAKWADALRKNIDQAKDPNFMSEMIAVLKRASVLDSKREPRASQILSLLMLLNAKDQGRLAQVSTGEGKSLSMAMFAALKVLQGEKVDIVTSNPILAVRDVKESESFFSILHMTVADNWDEKDGKQYVRGPKACYQADVVYGSIYSFQWDLLRDEYELDGTKGGRPEATVIADEADSMFVDGCANIGILGSIRPMMQYLEQLFVYTWNELLKVDQFFHFENGKLFYHDVADNISFEVENKFLYVEAILKNYLTTLITSPDSPLVIPKHLKEYALSQVENWAQAAINAGYHSKLGEQYVISKNKGKKVIAPVDLPTGVVQAHLVWDNGLHQFLQIKHRLELTSENMFGSFISNRGYFKRYGKNIYGLSGTLGSNDTHTLLEQAYHTDIVVVPTFKPKQFHEFAGILAENEDEWLKQITHSVKQMIESQRAVLLICENINAVKEIESRLKALPDFSAGKIKLYSRNDNDEKLTIADKVQPGDIIIATRLAGRGTDLATCESLEENGGLHVIETSVSDNLQGQLQIFGRTSRQGKLGTAQQILNKEAAELRLSSLLPDLGNAEDLVSLLHWRDLAEMHRLQKIKNYELKKITLKDDLFADYCQFRKTLMARDNNPHKLAEVEERWLFWLKIIVTKMNKETSCDSAVILEKFENFKQQIQVEFSYLEIRNPTEQVLSGNDNAYAIVGDKTIRFRLLHMPAPNVSKAIEEYTKAIAKDPLFAVQAYYNRAFSYVEGKVDNYKEHATNDLAAAKIQIEEYFIPSIQAIQLVLDQSQGFDLNESSSDTPLSKQMQGKLDLLRIQVQYIDRAIAVMQKASSNSEIVVGYQRTTLSELIHDGSTISKEVIQEQYNLGLVEFYQLKEIVETDDDFMPTFLKIAALGALQIVGGIYISTLSSSMGFQLLGAAAISEGVGDILYAARGALEGNLDWKAYQANKTISIATTVVLLGIDAIKNAAALRQASEASKLASKEVAKKIGKDELLKKAIEKVPAAFAMSGIKETFNFAVNSVTGSLIKNYKPKIASLVREKLSKELSREDLRLSLHKLFVVDACMGNFYYSNKLREIVSTILNPHRNRINDISSAVLKNVMASQHVVFNAVIKLSDMSDTLDKINGLLDDFARDFRVKVMELAGNAPSSFEIIEDLIALWSGKENAHLLIEEVKLKGMLSSDGTCDETKLDPNHAYKNCLIQACKRVKFKLKEDQTANVNALNETIMSRITKEVMSNVHNGLVKPVTQAIVDYKVNQMMSKKENTYHIMKAANELTINHRRGKDILYKLEESDKVIQHAALTAAEKSMSEIPDTARAVENTKNNRKNISLLNESYYDICVMNNGINHPSILSIPLVPIDSTSAPQEDSIEELSLKDFKKFKTTLKIKFKDHVPGLVLSSIKKTNYLGYLYEIGEITEKAQEWLQLDNLIDDEARRMANDYPASRDLPINSLDDFPIEWANANQAKGMLSVLTVVKHGLDKASDMFKYMVTNTAFSKSISQALNDARMNQYHISHVKYLFPDLLTERPIVSDKTVTIVEYADNYESLKSSAANIFASLKKIGNEKNKDKKIDICNGIKVSSGGRYLNPAADIYLCLANKTDISKSKTTIAIYGNGLWKIAAHGENIKNLDNSYNEGNLITRESCEIPRTVLELCKPKTH